jgi:cytochrome c-type biogenesis protein CcmH/NrfF
MYFHWMLFGLLIFGSVCLASDADSVRLRSLSEKVKCDCGCGDILSECPHKECKRRPILNQEISAAILRGDTDERILKAFAAKHGTAMLVTPLFQGFNTLLWIVPVLVAVISFAVLVVYRFRTSEPISGDMPP